MRWLIPRNPEKSWLPSAVPTEAVLVLPECMLSGYGTRPPAVDAGAKSGPGRKNTASRSASAGASRRRCWSSTERLPKPR